MRKINLGIIGFGNVGAGVIKILREKKALLTEKIGIEINVKKVCDKDIVSKRNVSVDKSLLTRNPKDIIDDPQIDIVVELVGGISPAKEFIVGALNKGKHVVTANKALLAQDGQELLSLADDRGKNIYFEASVGAGIPIIKSVREGLVANNFKSVYGIVNGTSNFILSQMSENNCSFNQALKQAQEKGFAEKDPTLDIEGIDSCHKLVLLTYLCFGKFVKISDVFVEGISKISAADVCYANEMDLQIKLLAIAKKEANDLEVRVHPTLIPKSSLLASVSGVFNAIYVDSDLAGDLLFYGPGAGQLSAASAVVSDIVDLTQNIKAGLFKPTLNIVQDKTIKNLRNTDDFESKYYIRFMALDKPGVLAKISGVLAKFGISIASVTQKEHCKAHAVPIVMIIHQSKERNLRQALATINRLDVIKEEAVAIRMEEI
ncbi:MAG: homoserine dehydrogenase [Candidatus Omnitrophica bacterium]|nr:homoserine dehydrogenase [Candidatus Omnitrophota bacterium]